MIKRGSIIIAKIDHFDDQFGDIYIESGDKFEVTDITNVLHLTPVDTRKYVGEKIVISREEFFNENC